MTTIAPLVFTCQDGELRRFRKQAGRSFYGKNESYSWWGLLLGMVLVIGLAVLAAQKIGLLAASQVPAVLIAAFAGYACSTALMMLFYGRSRRRVERDYESEKTEAERRITISDAGLAHKSENYDFQMTWKVVKSIETLPGVVIIWSHGFQFMPIPVRAFADDAARRAFITAVRAYIDGARKSGVESTSPVV
jgi:hypothetical protein